MKSVALIGCWMAVLTAGCASQTKPEVSQMVMRADHPVIVQLEGRSGTLTVKGGREQLLYSFQNREGKLLASNLSAAQFQAAYPAMFAEFERALAGDEAAHASVVTFDDHRSQGSSDSVPTSIELSAPLLSGPD